MLKLTTYNLSVQIETDDYILQSHIRNFLEKYYTIKQKGFNNPNAPIEEKVFVGKIKNQGIYQLHNTQFVHLYHYLKEIGYHLKVDEKVDSKVYNIISTNFKVREGWELRDNQKPVYEFLLNQPSKSKLVPLATGSGKSFISLAAIATLSKRLAVVVLSQFCEKWIKDIAEIHEAEIKDVLLIQGSKSVRNLVEMAKSNELDYDYFVFSARTLQEFISSYEEDPEFCIERYGCSPIDLFPLLGVGIMLNDETHLSFHAIYKILIYSNVEYQIGLSATLISEDHTTRRMHKVIYPSNCIYEDSMIKKYIDVYPVSYSMSHEISRMIKTTFYGSNNYSHIAFEQSILKKSFLLSKYFKIITDSIEDYYIQHYQSGDRLIIFVATVDLATRLTSYLKDIYPTKDIRRYCENDPYSDLMEAEFIITTVISAGTGVDIKGLRTAINTVSISSQPSNLQSLGRLRELKDRDVKFCYLYCDNINKQKQYHFKRMELFKDRVASISLRKSRSNLV